MPALRQLWSLRERRPRFVACALAVLAFLLVYPAIQWWLHSIGVAGRFGYFDLGAYRAAVNHYEAGETLYVRNEDGGFHGSYLYPPVYVLAFLPLEPFEFRQAGHVLNAVSVGTLWVGLQGIVTVYDVRIAWYERGLLLWAIVGYHPIILSMRLAQVSVALAAILSVALAALLYAENNDNALAQYASGVATAVGGTVKLIYAPVGAHLLQDRRRFAGAVGTGLVLLVVSFAVFGVEAHRNYFEVLTWGKGWGDARSPHIWGPAYYRPLVALGSTLGMVARLGGAAVITGLALLAADEGVDAETFVLGAAAVPLLAPRAYTQDLAIFLPVVVVLLATELSRENGRPLVPVVGLWFAAVHAYGLYFIVDVLAERLSVGEYIVTLSPVLQPGLWGTLLLVGLAIWRVAEATPVGDAVSERLVHTEGP